MAPLTVLAATNNWVHLGTDLVLGIHSDRRFRVERVGCKIAGGLGMFRPAGYYHNGDWKLQ